MGRGETGELHNRFSGDEDPLEDEELLRDEYDYFQLPFATVSQGRTVPDQVSIFSRVSRIVPCYDMRATALIVHLHVITLERAGL